MAGRGRRSRRNSGRPVQGILLLDKPAGLTSNEALQQVKHLYGARKAGHTGSLDKSATGLLPICFGEATKFSSYLLDADKHYHTTFTLGIETATGDAEGEILHRSPVPELDGSGLEAVLASFRGEISQVPPMYSALKHKGQRLYELAYQGIEVEREARPVTIYRLDLVGRTDTGITIDVRCSKGTYIRTLAADIGNAIGCGAHVSSLRRIGSGPFQEAEMISLGELEQRAEQGQAALDECLLPIDSAIRDLPGLDLVDNVAYYLNQGQAVMVPNAPTDGLVRLYSQAGRFLGVGEVLDDGRIAPRRLLTAAGARSRQAR